MHCDTLLEDTTFYDFVRCYRKRSKHGDISNGVLQRFKLCKPHADAQTHFLVEVADPAAERPGKEFAPRVIGQSIPRPTQNANSVGGILYNGYKTTLTLKKIC
jgi:hypothetical protein